MKDIRPQPGAQTEFLSTNADIAITGGAAFGGKAAKIDTLVPTPNGFKRLGEIENGDKVFAVDGSIATVIRAHPIRFHEESYDVVFDSGEVITVDGEHLWRTMDHIEREQAIRLTDEFREVRRSNRPSRKKDTVVKQQAQDVITKYNKEKQHIYKEVPIGTVRTTYEIMETLRFRSSRSNHSVELAGSVECEFNEFLIDPYLFGLWLGDGCATHGLIGCLEEDMDIMLKHINHVDIVSENINTVRYKRSYKTVRFRGFISYLRKNNLINNKHIPIEYLRSSVDQRLELLRGIMDTDGTCNTDGKCSIGLSNEVLIKDVRHLICSLGIKCSSISEKKIENCSSSFLVSFTSDSDVFHLPRKASRQKKRNVQSTRRYIADIRKAEPCFMRCIAIDHPSHLYLIGESFIPTHNTFSLLLEAARHISNPKYQAIIFRRESVQITSPGGLRDTSLDIYPHLGGEYRAQPTPRWIFPSGAQITMAHLNSEDQVLAYQGSQMALICYDELCHFSKFQFFYMLSRARSMSGIKSYIRGTCNPDPDSWVAHFISWWIDPDTGFPIKERRGVLRYMFRVNDEIIWADSKQELMSQHGCDEMDIMSVTFISSKATDNPLGLKTDPSYIGRLKALSKVERARLLDGNWLMRAQAGDYFPRNAVTVIDWLPTDVVKWVRSWDLAATEEGEARDPDFTVGILIGRRSNGKIVVGDVVRVRRKANEVQSLIKNLAVKDGYDVWQSLPQDPGAAGKAEKESYQRLLQGFTVLTRTINKNKVLIASSGADSPAALWQRGEVEIVRANWNKDFLDECDAFPTKGVHDDQVDALSSGIRALPGHSRPDYSNSGLSGRFKEIRTSPNKYKTR